MPICSNTIFTYDNESKSQLPMCAQYKLIQKQPLTLFCKFSAVSIIRALRHETVIFHERCGKAQHSNALLQNVVGLILSLGNHPQLQVPLHRTPYIFTENVYTTFLANKTIFYPLCSLINSLTLLLDKHMVIENFG